MSRKAAAASLLFVLLLSGAACGPAPAEVGRTETPRGKNPPGTSLPLPPTTPAAAQSFTLLDGDRRANLSDYLGRVVVVDFWATFCQPCVEEAPHLDALQSRFGPQGLQVIGLNVGGEDDLSEIPSFVERLKIKYALGVPAPEMVNFYMGSDGSIPQTLVFDRRGRVVRHFVGYDPNVKRELESTIEKEMMNAE